MTIPVFVIVKLSLYFKRSMFLLRSFCEEDEVFGKKTNFQDIPGSGRSSVYMLRDGVSGYGTAFRFSIL